jgi:hypothetical protein
MNAALAGDVDAAVRVIALDLEWPEDWWNGGPSTRFLEADIKLLSKLRPNAGRELELALLAASLATQDSEADKTRSLVTTAGLLDAKPSLPANGRVVSYLLTLIHDHNFASKDDLREQWGPVLGSAAKESADPELHHALAWLHLEQPELNDIDLQGWQKTGDARFAASYLGGAMQRKELTLDSQHLVRALAEFPDNYVIQSIPLGLTPRGTPRYREALIATIKADYVQLPRVGVFPRPSAKALRMVFAELAEVIKP